MNISTSKRKFSSIILKMLKKINKIGNFNINFDLTTQKFIQEQLNDNFTNTFMNNFNENKMTISSVLLFLNKNKSHLKNIKIFTLDRIQPVFLKEIVKDFLKNSQKNIITSKLFYFYLNLLLIEKFNKNNSSKDFIRKKIEEIINNKCLKEKKKLINCFFKNRKELDIIPIDQLENKIKKACGSSKTQFENCIQIPTILSLH